MLASWKRPSFATWALEGTRADGRSAKQIRQLYCEVGFCLVPTARRIFQRGETQALMTITLGTTSDEQKRYGRPDGRLLQEVYARLQLPPYSVGECKPIRTPGRREMGHGALAEQNVKAVLPGTEKFPYTIRIVSDITESNGSQ